MNIAEHGPNGPEDADRTAERTVAALAALADGLRRTAPELLRLADRADHLRQQVETGAPIGPIMATEERPLVITQLTAITDLIHELGGAVRRAEAQQLRGEGYTQEAIAEVFGVSRQRAGALLRPVPADRRGPKRPGRPNG